MAALQCEDCKKMYGSGDGEGGHCCLETSAAFTFRPTESGAHLDPRFTKTPVDSGGISPDERGYLCGSHAGVVERGGYWNPTLTSMLSRMVSDTDRSEVLWSVIGSVPIQVMNVLSISDDSVEHPVLVGFDVLELPHPPTQPGVPVGSDVAPGRPVRYLLSRGELADGTPRPLPLTTSAISALWRTRDLKTTGLTRFRDNDHAVILVARALCHESFASNTAFDAHILRTVIGRPHLQVAVAGEPWRQNRKGYWTNEPEREWTGPGSDAVAQVVSADAAE